MAGDPARKLGAGVANECQSWLVKADLQTIEVLRLDGSTYRIVRVFRGADPVRMEPFEAREMSLDRVWQR